MGVVIFAVEWDDYDDFGLANESSEAALDFGVMCFLELSLLYESEVKVLYTNLSKSYSYLLSSSEILACLSNLGKWWGEFSVWPFLRCSFWGSSKSVDKTLSIYLSKSSSF